MDSDAGQSGQYPREESTHLALPEAAKRLQRSPKTVRRYIREGRFGDGAVQTVAGKHGDEYRIEAEAVGRLAGELGRVPVGIVPGGLKGQGSIERRLGAIVQGALESAVQGLQDAQTAQLAELAQTLTDALATQQTAAEAREQALLAEVRELRAELQEERERRSWWQRIVGRRHNDGTQG
jgi:hypothetical protein